MDYIKRIADKEIDKRIKAFNAINIVGPKGCGKTRTASERCNTIIEFQDEEKRDGYLSIAQTSPQFLLENEKPILFDEWQDAPKLWGAIRKNCDDYPEDVGQYYLTGSTSKKVETPHTGTGRITQIELLPMTLYETGESNGMVSITELFDNPNKCIGCKSDTTLEDLFFATCRGGWPRTLSIRDQEAKLEIARDYYRQICNADISAVDNVSRNPEYARLLIKSYARNMATTVKKKTIYADVKANQNVSDVTLSSYIEALERLFIIKDIDAWTPQIRSKTAIRSARKHIFVDPSIGLASLGISPEYFKKDIDYFGHVFENMVLRDLLVFAESHNAKVMHYTDDNGLEADAVYQLSDGRYALIEIKVGVNSVPSAEKNLIKFSELINKHNKKAKENTKHPGVEYREPDLLIVICANAPMSYITENGVIVLPVGCVRD